MTGGELASQGVLAYLDQAEATDTAPSSLFSESARIRQSEYDQLRKSNGKENPYQLHAELTEIMWNNVGIWRVQKELISARSALHDLRVRAHQCGLIDDSGWTNQAVPFARAVINMIEQSLAIVEGAIVRDESRGAHFKMDTPDRNDKDWLKTTLAEWTPDGPKFEFEPVDCSYIAPRPRKYKINQNTIVKKILGDDFLDNLLGKKSEEPTVKA